ncbi:hypothetical protein [Streptomyces sp. OK228]|uniref:hypothetical protein n=1 Tax=Streptomyces sp. OK228 TaxID=1882786 RepID=UPI000BD85C4A|nr:hypothetical protein [Streptomyces sp. OK228]SOE25608.1 hypothetical protein SAMN05442782_2350 [Streptomyces sp. OK228]
MAKLVLRDCYIVINGVNFSDHASSVEVDLSKAEVETTNFSGSGRERVAGLKDDGFVINFQQDYAAAQIDATFYPLWNNETEFTVEVRPTSAAASTTNPKYTATCILLEYKPLSGKVGDLSETQVKLPAQRTGITRATS